ncbi:hypothetical protein BC937DRAFT_91318 [Endogone sp. FLAS-F59071]|nr:hypothetical protein BC937DRAFT_91318 [Endogone sp. FLAS-F59071]|eukprot:RUS16344.1 hypothetical protein BC937DRAFT_91318 [Endogone sp. FLAS-F59071]
MPFWILEQIEASQHIQDLKMNILQSEIEAKTICNCWYYTRILPISSNSDLCNLLEHIHQTPNIALNDLAKALEALHLSDAMMIKLLKR